ncbi:hypothetical protein CFB84_43680 [Burkholderia aenigmatica]|uniref:Uncharacterized protein n=1 Tax=Burkholderia aenigmatica TaxID=2015348 RepID=A0A228HHA0_9BURK|nr:hypothetical protein CFB84_43680 [Burkholderia aenigmatica]
MRIGDAASAKVGDLLCEIPERPSNTFWLERCACRRRRPMQTDVSGFRLLWVWYRRMSWLTR